MDFNFVVRVSIGFTITSEDYLYAGKGGNANSVQKSRDTFLHIVLVGNDAAGTDAHDMLQRFRLAVDAELLGIIPSRIFPCNIGWDDAGLDFVIR
jgi:hypothetical protein